jgi:mRNA-degrading endonuclease RelE of RelBE toxin-antitoxin system
LIPNLKTILSGQKKVYELDAHPFRWVDMKVDAILESPCELKNDRCLNCHRYFMAVRSLIKAAVVSRHFIKDLKDEEEMNSIVKDILDCSNVAFFELHKFEENINGNLIFRAKKAGIHIVYAIDKQMRIVFLRAFKNYSEYGKFLEDKKEIEKMIVQS